MEIGEWLHGLGLGQYARAFADNTVQWDVLPKLTGDDLKDIGVVAVGDRRRLLDAIALFREPPLAVAPQIHSELVHSPNANEAERRQLTVIFCDLVGSTALSVRLDPEDLRDVIGAYHRAVAEEVERFGGFIAKYMGDGVLVYFGYPHAEEDDAERAVHAGLALIERVPALDTAARLQTRIGIATGLVVVGDLIGEGAAQERGVIGETPNLAARLQAIAEPNTLLIGETTRRLIGDFFECRDLGVIEMHGFAEPQRAWRVLAKSIVISRFEALRSGATPLIGRAEELELLEQCWQHAKSGQGRVVLVSGEAGIGKSRLSAEIVRRIESEPHLRLRYFCSPHHQDSALYPFIVQLERAAEFGREDSLEERRGKLEALLALAGHDPSGVELIAELLALST